VGADANGMLLKTARLSYFALPFIVDALWNKLDYEKWKRFPRVISNVGANAPQNPDMYEPFSLVSFDLV
jgi:hypothetical protein